MGLIRIAYIYMMRKNVRVLVYDLLKGYLEALNTPSISDGYLDDFIDFMDNWAQKNKIVLSEVGLVLSKVLRDREIMSHFGSRDDSLEPVMIKIATQYELSAMHQAFLGIDEETAVKLGVIEGFELYNKKYPKDCLYPHDHLYYIQKNIDKQEHAEAFIKQHPGINLEELLLKK